MNPEDIVKNFVNAINHQDIEAISALMTDDHLFIDSMGKIYEGRETMKQAWIAYYSLVPDYIIEVSEMVVSESIAILLGKAKGTFRGDGNIKEENRWETPAAWRAEVSGDKIAHWQIYADLEPLRAIIRRAESSSTFGKR